MLLSSELCNFNCDLKNEMVFYFSFSDEVHLRDAVLTIYGKPYDDATHEYIEIMAGRLEDRVSKSEFEEVDNGVSTAVSALGVLSISNTLANSDLRLCGPAQLLVVLDEEKLFFDKDRSDNIFATKAIVACPGDLLAGSQFTASRTSYSAVYADPITWTVLPQDEKNLLKQSKVSELQFTVNVWDPNSIWINTDNQLSIEGFKMKQKGLASNSSLGSTAEIESLKWLKVVDNFRNNDYSSYEGQLRLTISKEICSFLSENKALETVSTAENVALNLIWDLKIDHNHTRFRDLIQYNNEIQLVSDIICGNEIDLIIPQLPEEKAEILLMNDASPSVFYGEPLSFRMQMEMDINDNALNTLLCESGSNSNQNEGPSELEMAICPNGFLKSNVGLLLSIKLSKATTGNQAREVFANQLIGLNEGQLVNVKSNGIINKIATSFTIEGLRPDEDDMFQLCSELSSALYFEVSTEPY